MTIKISRAKKLSRIGVFHTSFDACLTRIPPAVVTALSAQLLADLVDAIWAACQDAEDRTEREAIADGAVWDAVSEKFVEFRV
jgi:hypothetical protein